MNAMKASPASSWKTTSTSESSNSEQREAGGASDTGTGALEHRFSEVSRHCIPRALMIKSSSRLCRARGYGHNATLDPPTTLRLATRSALRTEKKALTNQLEKSVFYGYFWVLFSRRRLFSSNLAHAAVGSEKRRIKWVHLFINKHLCKKPFCHLGNRQVVYLAAVAMTNTFAQASVGSAEERLTFIEEIRPLLA